MKNIKILLLIILLMPIVVYAQRGCCSSHGGEAGCASDGRRICADGTISPTCTCTPEKVDVYGCTDSSASNYNPNATINNGTCVYDVLGCMDSNAKNYNKDADKDDGSCKYDIKGCMDSSAENYNKNATVDDGSCSYPSEDEAAIGEIIGGILTVGLAVGGYKLIKKSKEEMRRSL